MATGQVIKDSAAPILGAERQPPRDAAGSISGRGHPGRTGRIFVTETTESLDTSAADAKVGTADATGSGRGRARRGEGLSSMVLPDLKALAGQLGIRGTSGMRKGDLVAAITARQNGAGASAPKQGHHPTQCAWFETAAVGGRERCGARRTGAGNGRYEWPLGRSATAARRPGRRARAPGDRAGQCPPRGVRRHRHPTRPGATLRSGAAVRPGRTRRPGRAARRPRAERVRRRAVGRLRRRRPQPPQPARPSGRTRVQRQRRRAEFRSEQGAAGRPQS